MNITKHKKRVACYIEAPILLNMLLGSESKKIKSELIPETYSIAIIPEQDCLCIHHIQDGKRNAHLAYASGHRRMIKDGESHNKRKNDIF